MAMQKTALMLFGLFLLSGPVLATPQEVLEIDVAGMTCAFCAYGGSKRPRLAWRPRRCGS